jgi:predicted ATPase/transcriptional regulator with XRE-family HTH domain
MDERQPFGAILKRFRLAAGLTHEALAARASLGARTISDLERGVSRAPRADTLALLVEALGLTPEQRVLLETAARPGLDSPATAAPTPPVGNLPVQLSSFVGREHEARAVQDLVRRDDIRLVTLTGPGGVGKTRLALQVAGQVGAAFPAGAFAAELAPVTDRDGVCRAIGRALGLPDEGRLIPATLVASLGGKSLLLVLDNFEHLLDAAPLVAELLRGASRLKVLATSRAALRLSGEQEFPVPPLPVPDPAHLPALEALAGYAAVGLFVDRATRVRPDFALAADNAGAIAAICAQLDGLPLAIELAAARVRTLPPRVLLERLREATERPSLHLLAGGPRDAPARHQTLRETIAWSYDLLSEPERALFRRLAVFSGGCTLEAAEYVGGTGGEGARDRRFGGAQDESSVPAPSAPAVPPAPPLLDLIDSLVDKSLLDQTDGPDGEPRFVMLETIRAFAWEQFAASGEEAMVRRRHAEHYLALVEATGGLLFAAAPKRARSAAEQGNIQAALRWLVQQG